MKIANKTGYDSGDLRAFIWWVVEKESREAGWDAAKRKRLKITVKHSKKWHTWRFHRNAVDLTVYIPKRGERMSKMTLAASIAAGVACASGSSNWKFGRYDMYHGEPKKFWSEAEALQLRMAESTAVKPTAGGKTRDKYMKALEKVIECERKAKLADTLLKKWKLKARYYEKKLKEFASPEVPTVPNRTHEECGDCDKEKVEPPQCQGHRAGEVACEGFAPKETA